MLNPAACLLVVEERIHLPDLVVVLLHRVIKESLLGEVSPLVPDVCPERTLLYLQVLAVQVFELFFLVNGHLFWNVSGGSLQNVCLGQANLCLE